jgi:hypothetical protein
MKNLKVKFVPLEDPKPVTLDMMPYAVPCVVSYQGSLAVRLRVAHGVHRVKPDGNGHGCHANDNQDPSFYTVLSRLDGLPLPSGDGEPVPLDTLETWPVWYRDAEIMGEGYVSQGADGDTVHDDGATSSEPSNVRVYPRPYMMVTEVEDADD